MQTYIVGGYIRDEMLGVPSHDRDFVVVGATHEEMIELGYKQVGADFPVYLSKDSEEFALARTERKNGDGYKGFAVNSDFNITIEQDLVRRDISINAMALEHGVLPLKLIDPCNGIQDLKDRVLRHCSEAFRDDPLRVLRVARFMAKFFDKGFRIAPETMQLMREMVAYGELNHLTPERIWLETVKALETNHPSAYFNTLLECGALKVVFPELDALTGVDQPAAHHPEIDTYVHVMMCVDLSAKLKQTTVQRFAALVHDLGKGITPKDELPQHKAHEHRGVPLVEAMCDRLKVPNPYRWMGVNACRYHLNIHTVKQLTHKTLLRKIILIGGSNVGQAGRVLQLIDVCMVDAKGRLGFENNDYPQREYLIGAINALHAIDNKALLQFVPQERIVETLHRKRLSVLKDYINSVS